MKNVRIHPALRTVAFILAAVLMLGAVSVTSILSVFAADTGMSFTQNTLYKGTKVLTAAPNTIEAWVKLDATDGAADGRAGVIYGNYSSANPPTLSVSLEIHANGVPRLYYTDENNVNHDIMFSDVHINTGEWLHLAVTYDATANLLRCYVDGELKQTVNPTTEAAHKNMTSFKTPTHYPMVLGGDMRNNNDRYFHGEIKALTVYSDLRTDAEILADKNAAIGTPATDNLLAAYDLTVAPTGYVIEDLSGNGYNVTGDPDYVYVPEINNTGDWFTEKTPVTDYAYSFAVVGDTQVISEKAPEQMATIYQWIADNVESKKIQYVVGLGDITEKNQKSEWITDIAAINKLTGKVPYGLVRGNHDFITNPTWVMEDWYKEYVNSIGYSAQYDGAQNGDPYNTYKRIEIGEMKYLFLNLDYGPDDATLAWASEVVEAHPSYNVIVSTHAYLFRDGTTLDANDVYPPTKEGFLINNLGRVPNNGDHMWDEFISQHENIVMVLSGHDPSAQIVTLQSAGVKGNTVTQMLIDAQGVDAELSEAGEALAGMVAILYFSADGTQMQVEYYSPIRDAYYMESNQFTMTVDTVDYTGDDSFEEMEEELNKNKYENVQDITISSGHNATPGYWATHSTFGKHLSIPTGKRLKQFSIQTVTGGSHVSGKISYAIYQYDDISVETTLLDDPIYASTEDVTCNDWGYVVIDIPKDTIVRGDIVVVFSVNEGSGTVFVDSANVNRDIVKYSFITDGARGANAPLEEREWEASIQLADWIVEGETPAPDEGETNAPSEDETGAPAEDETNAPAEDETGAPAEDETNAPAEDETGAPAEDETNAPAEDETNAPTEDETNAPAEDETNAPAEEDTNAPVEDATNAPSEDATNAPAEDATSGDETDAVADTGDTDAPAGDDDMTGKGCGSVISVGGATLLAAMAAAVALRKKRED